MSDRSVATDALATLGTIIDDTARRDAIHLAVIPVVAGQSLDPGNHITVTDGVASYSRRDQAVGIVDPFLPSGVVLAGQRFWCVILPRTINSLRHVWTHPAFPDEPVVGAQSKQKIDSEQWLRDFCNRSECPDYDRLMEIVSGEDEWSRSCIGSDSLFVEGSEASGDIPPEFWVHVENVLGRKIANHPTYFSCSC